MIIEEDMNLRRDCGDTVGNIGKTGSRERRANDINTVCSCMKFLQKWFANLKKEKERERKKKEREREREKGRYVMSPPKVKDRI